MMNDHAWMQLHAHRESEHRARARRRGGDDNPAGSARPSPGQRLRRLSALVASPVTAVRPAPAPAAALAAAVITAVPAGRAAGRRTASAAPTASALAWARLASGTGTLEPAAPPTTALERDAA